MPPRVPPDRPRTPAPFVPPPIAGLATGIGLFVGTTVRGPSGVATRVVDRATFGATFGEPDGRHPLGWSIGHFFDNGGATAWVVALPVDGFATALVRSLAPGGACDAIDRFDVLCVPGLADPSTQVAVQAASAARGAFFVMDCDAGATAASLARGPRRAADRTGRVERRALCPVAARRRRRGRQACLSAIRFRGRPLCAERCRPRGLAFAGRTRCDGRRRARPGAGDRRVPRRDAERGRHRRDRGLFPAWGSWRGVRGRWPRRAPTRPSATCRCVGSGCSSKPASRRA